jgi:hypothetical protein
VLKLRAVVYSTLTRLCVGGAWRKVATSEGTPQSTGLISSQRD